MFQITNKKTLDYFKLLKLFSFLLCNIFANCELLLVATAAPQNFSCSISQWNRAGRTSFQTSTPYQPEYDIKTDIVILNTNVPEKIKSWQKKGYEIYVMAGFRENEDFVYGRVDGKKHLDEVQMLPGNIPKTIEKTGYYMVPSKNRIGKYVDYFKKAIDYGAKAVCPEEPEYFTGTGYSKAFKEEWREFYGEKWMPPHASVNSRYKSERLKSEMELRMISEIFKNAKLHKLNVKNFLLIHSPVNYAAWDVSFQYGKAVNLDTIDGIVAQVWTGTARSPVKYHGEFLELTFENAFLEYSSMKNLVRGKKIEMWFLADPLEDNPARTLADYKKNYEHTITASLLFPDVKRFEVLPWPNRIFGRIPDDYEVEVLSVVNALTQIGNQKEFKMEAGTEGIGVLISDTIVWQRGLPSITSMDNFYGLSMPLVKQGIPVEVMNVERILDKGYLDKIKVILLSYDGWKPIDKRYNEAINEWVRSGGVLIFFGGNNPYNTVDEWWSKEGYQSPKEHLFKVMISEAGGTRYEVRGMNVEDSLESASEVLFGSKEPSTDSKNNSDTKTGIKTIDIPEITSPPPSPFFETKIGKGKLISTETPPQFFAESENADKLLRKIVRYAVENIPKEYKETGYIKVKRGKYLIARAISKSLELKGNFVDLFSTNLKLLNNKKLEPGENAFLVDINRLNLSVPRLIASSSRIECLSENKKETNFASYGPTNTKGFTRIFMGNKKKFKIYAKSVNGEKLKYTSKKENKTLLITYDNMPEGVYINIKW